MNKKEYTIDYHEPFYYLKERKKWWILSYNKILDCSGDYTYIEKEYKKLTDKDE